MAPDAELLMNIEATIIPTRCIRRDTTAGIRQNGTRLIVQIEVAICTTPLRAAPTTCCDLPVCSIYASSGRNVRVFCAVVGVGNGVIAAISRSALKNQLRGEEQRTTPSDCSRPPSRPLLLPLPTSQREGCWSCGRPRLDRTTRTHWE